MLPMILGHDVAPKVYHLERITVKATLLTGTEVHANKYLPEKQPGKQ